MIKTTKAASIALFATAIISFGMIAKAQSQQNYFRYTIDGQFGTGPTTGGPQIPPSQNNLSVSVAPATSNIFVGQAYAAVATATNASAGAVFGIVNASAPIANFGLGIDAATGSITGTLTTSGTLTFQVRATDGDRTATSNVVSIAAVQPVVTYNRSTYQIGSAFSSGPPATNIPNPIFSLEPGAPPWAGIDSQTGIVVGTPSGVTAGQPTFSK